MFIESVITEKIYKTLTHHANNNSCLNFKIEWVAKNSDELKAKGVDPNFLNEDDLPPDDEYYYARIWVNCDLEDIYNKLFLEMKLL